MERLEGTWLIAVSAGPDSMALLSMCLEAGIDCACAHVNYHHRKQAEEEESYIRLFCAENNIPLFVRNEEFTYEGNFEAAARKWRYEFFVQLVKQNGYKGVLIAHHEDDLLETYFMQEEKNLVPSYYGLREEMMYQGVLVKRPLLGYTKQQLLDYCRQHRIRFYEDATNSDPSLTRNRIRIEIVSSMSRTERDLVRREIRMKNAVMQERSCRVNTMISKGRVNLDRYRRLEKDDRIALLRKVIEQEHHYSLSFVEQLDGVLMKRDDFNLKVDVRHLVQEDGMFFMTKPSEPYSYTFLNKEEILSFRGAERFRIDQGEKGVNALSVREDDFPVVIRNAEKGDQIQMRFGNKKVHRFFIDRHIPLYLRDGWPVVVNREGRVILVPGLGCDPAHFSISPDFNVIQLRSS